MKDREFKKRLDQISDKKKVLCPNKIELLSSDEKNTLINGMVRRRYPVPINLIDEKTDVSWLHCMGYMQYFRGKKFLMICTCEQKIALQNKK